MSRVPPSKYQPRARAGESILTAGKKVGIAAEARTWTLAIRTGS
ncbi:MAG: hypothetical protein WKF31_12035 [Thermoleophilaceae bacterium]